jgi:kumamolisin
MKFWPSALIIASIVASSMAMAADPWVHVPASSIENRQDAGKFAHTNYLIYTGPRQEIDPLARLMPEHGPSMGFFAGPSGLHPDQVRNAYGVPYSGAPSGGSGTIAIIIAYHYPTAKDDFNVFSNQFGLPVETSSDQTLGSNQVFQVVYAGNKAPRSNAGWNQEAAMDIEWTHAMAPDAKIVLVEANSNSFADLFAAIDKAKTLPNVKCISMSWGSGEFSSETSYDSKFNQAGAVYFASSGDSGGVKSYPAVSPNVVGVGGTHLVVDTAGNVSSESAWSGSGCGISSYEARPAYQNSLGYARRTSADISAVADPYTGASVYCSSRYQGWVGWLVFGGTSLSAPICAGMYNLSGSRSTSSFNELTYIYGHQASFRDILSGSAGSNAAKAGYDLPTGVGAPVGTNAL